MRQLARKPKLFGPRVIGDDNMNMKFRSLRSVIGFCLMFAAVACASSGGGNDEEDESAGGVGGSDENAGGEGGELAAGGEGGEGEEQGGQGGAASEGGVGGGAGGGGTSQQAGAGGSAGNGGTGGVALIGGQGGVTAAPFMVTFKTKCATCHGETGEGTPKGPHILHPVKDFSTWLVRNGRKHPSFPEAMPKFTEAEVPTVQLNQILAFLSEPPKPTTGRDLFNDFCRQCHGADGKLVSGHNIATKTAQEFITNVRNGHHPGEFERRTGYMPKWSAAELTDAEIRLMNTYLRSL